MFVKFVNKKNKGFTLIEMLVSLALFSIFLVAIMGTIFTIVDTNKKARSMMTVMNNLSFTMDAMTRSFKTGTNSQMTGTTCFETQQINYQDPDIQDPINNPIPRELVKYCFVPASGNSPGKITRTIGGVTTDFTSPDIDIQKMTFERTNATAGNQPRLLITMTGTVKVSDRVSSSFSLQTSVTQSKLNP